MSWDILGKIFGADKIVDKGMSLIDEAFYTPEEEAGDKKEMVKERAKAKVTLLTAYAPYKLAQRYIAFTFTAVFVFIMLNGILGSLYGVVSMDNVNQARDFANEMNLGSIMMTIIGFYFGAGFVESMRRKQ